MVSDLSHPRSLYARGTSPISVRIPVRNGGTSAHRGHLLIKQRPKHNLTTASTTCLAGLRHSNEPASMKLLASAPLLCALLACVVSGHVLERPAGLACWFTGCASAAEAAIGRKLSSVEQSIDTTGALSMLYASPCIADTSAQAALCRQVTTCGQVTASAR